MKSVDVIVIGGGILGCFAARSLMRWKLSVLLLEEKEDLCRGITRANSAIVYSGYDNKAGSLKAQMTVRANAGFDALCRELDVPFVRCGSLAVSFGPEADRTLQKKYENGLKNKVPGIRLLTGEEAKAMEPQLTSKVTSALYAPTTGTVNPWKLGIAAFENAAENGCKSKRNTKVTGIRKNGQGYVVTCEIAGGSAQEQLMADSGNRYRKKQRTEIACRAVLNCAGLSSDRIQELLFPPSVRIVQDASCFLVMDRGMQAPGRIIFQELETGKGITAVPSAEGNLILESVKHDQRGTQFAVDVHELKRLKEMSAEVLPELDCSQVIRSFGAVRPNPQEKDGRNIGSFVIEHPAPGFYSLIGIKTPGITCADELGMYLAERTAGYLEAVENPDFNPVRKGIPSLHRMSFEQRVEFVKEHPDYGEIICQCEDISRGEVLEAIRRGAVTVDGVKRRAGTGMGRCQGSRCSRRIRKLLEENIL